MSESILAPDAAAYGDTEAARSFECFHDEESQLPLRRMWPGTGNPGRIAAWA